MSDSKTKPNKPGIAGRFARNLGTFNIVYGTIGLACAALIQFAFPSDLVILPKPVLVASSIASISAIVQGLVLRIYGPVVTDFIGRRIVPVRTWTSSTARRLIASMKEAA